MNTIKENDFFKDLNWNELIDFKIAAPYIPTNKEVNFKLNEKNEKYEDFMMKNNPDENYENYDYDDIPGDYDKNWVDEF